MSELELSAIITTIGTILAAIIGAFANKPAPLTKRGLLWVGAIIGLVLGFLFSPMLASKIMTNSIIIKCVKIDSIGNVSNGMCGFESPCQGLQRGSRLNIEIEPQGYAVAYLQDATGNFYNQEGRLLINDNSQGDIRLWPGTSRSIEESIFKLYIVVSNRKLPIVGDSEKLSKLPNGKKWGPVYLKMNLQTPESEKDKNTPANQKMKVPEGSMIQKSTGAQSPNISTNGDVHISY